MFKPNPRFAKTKLTGIFSIICSFKELHPCFQKLHKQSRVTSWMSEAYPLREVKYERPCNKFVFPLYKIYNFWNYRTIATPLMKNELGFKSQMQWNECSLGLHHADHSAKRFHFSIRRAPVMKQYWGLARLRWGNDVYDRKPSWSPSSRYYDDG